MQKIKMKIKKHMSIFLAVLMIGTAVPLSILATDIASQYLTGTDALRTDTDGVRTNTDAVKTNTDADWDDDWDDAETSEYKWRLEDDTIIISGSGKANMWDCDWSMIKTPVKKIIIEDGITSLSWPDSGEDIIKKVETITIPKSLSSFYDWFDNDTYSRTVRFIVDSENKNYFTDEYGVLFKGSKNYGATLLYCPSDVYVKDYVIPDGVISIGEPGGGESGTTPFYKCENIETISIPSSVEWIYEAAIYECYNIKKIIVSEDNKDFYADEMGVLYVSTSGYGYLFDFGVLYCPANIQTNNYTVLENPNGGTVSLGAYAFGDVQVELTVNLPKSFGGWHGDGGVFKGKILFNIDSEHETDWDWSEKGALYSKYHNYEDNTEEIHVIIPGGVNSIYRISEGTQSVRCGGKGDLIVPCSVEEILFADNGYSNERRVHYLGTEEEWNQVICYSWFDDLSVTVHFASVEEENPATCTSVGYTEGIYCSECNTYVYGHEEIEIDDHAIVYHNAKTPTCTEIGWDAYETCENCDYTTYNEIPATGHSHKATVTKPTCTEEGYTTYDCTCGDSYVSDKVSALGHNFTDYIHDNNATCVENGTTSAYCNNNCGEKDVQIIENSTTDHKDTNDDDTCDECGKELENKEKEPFSLKKFVKSCIVLLGDFVKLIKSFFETVIA